MVRSNLIRYEITGVQGIDQQVDKASGNSLADARNVWAPDGKVVVRPGYEGVGALPGIPVDFEGTWYNFDLDSDSQTGGDIEPSQNSPYQLRTSASALGQVALFNLDGDALSGTTTRGEVTGIGTPVGAFSAYTTSGSAGMYMEYLTESDEWKKLNYYLFLGDPSEPFTLDADNLWRVGFTLPKDAKNYSTQDSGNIVRFGFFAPSSSPGNMTMTATGFNIMAAVTSNHEIYGLLDAEFADAKKAFIVYNSTASGEGFSIRGQNSIVDTYGTNDPLYELGSEVTRREAPTIAVNPEFNECFVATAGTDTVRGALDPSDDFNLGLAAATIETRDALVGENAPFDPTLIAQDQQWPHAKYISFFRGRLWVAGLPGLPFQVKWSAASPAHKVWPSLNFENLMENDNSPITGLHPLGEHMCVFKQDSIWMMVYNGLNAFGQPTFLPRQVVAGVGCVANSSIQEIRGNLIFLSEDGIYAFDGTPDIKKLSDPLQETIKDIDPARRPFSSSAHWRKNSLYLLSVSTDGDGTTNDTTIVYDYKNGTWWLWDNIDAQHWLILEGSGDDEEVYFGDSKGAIFRFASGKTDHGAAIASYVTTQRMDYRKNIKRRVRQIELTCDNKTRTATFKILPNDAHPDDVTAVTVPFTDANEIDWADLDWGSGDTDSWSRKRRRARRAGARVDYDWFQVRVDHSTKGQPFELGLIDVGAKSLGRR
jgi:hypothetical protein